LFLRLDLNSFARVSSTSLRAFSFVSRNSLSRLAARGSSEAGARSRSRRGGVGGASSLTGGGPGPRPPRERGRSSAPEFVPAGEPRFDFVCGCVYFNSKIGCLWLRGSRVACAARGALGAAGRGLLADLAVEAAELSEHRGEVLRAELHVPRCAHLADTVHAELGDSNVHGAHAEA